MSSQERTYIAIDLKSFYASVECVERGLNPLNTNLVVADASRTEKTICLAVSPSLKARGIPGRPRLFEVVEMLKKINEQRRLASINKVLTGKSTYDDELQAHPDWRVDYITATPRMSLYLKYSAKIYSIYLKYVAPEDIHVYSVDEVFIDATPYLKRQGVTAHEFAMKMIRNVLQETGITATAGIGTNLYLSKVAMDIVAKHIDADKDGVRIAELDERKYREQLWSYRPLTSFWRVGRGVASKLKIYGILTMGDIARQSVVDDELLYKLFGVNAELLIDHAWGWEPCTMRMIKRYVPKAKSLSNGQVLQRPYSAGEARVVIQEMAEDMAMKLLDNNLTTLQVVVSVGYDAANMIDKKVMKNYNGELHVDHYGRLVPKHAHGSESFDTPTSSSMLISKAALSVYDRIINKSLLVRRLNLTVCDIADEQKVKAKKHVVAEPSLFINYESAPKTDAHDAASRATAANLQQAILGIRNRYGKNSILKGLDFADGATAIERHNQIGGHKA